MTIARPVVMTSWQLFESVSMFLLSLERIDDIITMVFQYLNMVKQAGIQKWILDEERVS